MDNTFAEHVEAVARFQYYSDEAAQRIDQFISRIHTLENMPEQDREYLQELLSKLKPLIIKKLVLKSFL